MRLGGDESGSSQAYRPVAYVCGSCGVQLETGALLTIEDEPLKASLCQLAQIPVG